MASDVISYLQRKDQDTAMMLANLGHRAAVEGDWLRLEHAITADRACALSQQLSTIAVICDLDTIVDQIWIRCYDAGYQVRALRYAGGEGWTDEGEPQAFEAATALAAWRAAPRVLASPDGYDVLSCFLGKTAPPSRTVEEPNAPYAVVLDEHAVAELEAIAGRHGIALGAALDAAWALGAAAVYARWRRVLEADPDMVSLVGPEIIAGAMPGPHPVPALAHEPIDVAPLPRGDKVTCKLALATTTFEESGRMAVAFDRARSAALAEAYAHARARLL